jgi:hypothetical protein
MTDKGLMLPNEDYVVVPLAVRNRIMQRLNAAERCLADARAEMQKICDEGETPDWVRPWFEIDNLRVILLKEGP